MPAAEWVAASVPKRGHRADENEDATAANGLRFAVADGATEGWEAGRWAARLAAAFVAGPPGPADFPAWLAAARDWAPPVGESEPWYAAAKREQGSFATLVGLDLRRSRATPGWDWAWRALAVGDSCLFHVRGDGLELAAPLTAPAEFGNRPPLVPSSAVVRCPEPEWYAGRAKTGDLLLLATDAAAAHLLRPGGLAAGLTAARTALAAAAPGPLADWCRAVQDTTNDDVTVLAVRLHPAPEPS